MTDPRRRINYWTPWFRDSSGITNYSELLLPELAEHVDVSLVHPDARESRFRTRKPHEASRVNLDDADVEVFHLGNNLEYHHWMLAPILKRHGIVVVHDWSLFDMMRQLYQRSEFLWQRELVYNGESDPQVHEHRDDPGFLMAHPMNRRYLYAADVVVAHSEYLRDLALGLYPELDVRYIPHPSLVLPLAPLQPDAVLTVLGGIGRHKKTPWALSAFALIADRFPTARLRIVGRGDDKWEVERLRAQAIELGIDTRVDWHLDVDKATYLKLLGESLIVISMRAETAGETSGVMKEAWGAGRVVLTSDQPQFRCYDERICRRIPINDDAPRAMADVMADALAHPARYEADGRFAHDTMEDSFTYAAVAEQHAALIDELARRRPHGVTSGLNMYASFGTPSGIAEVARRLATTLVDANVPITTPPGFQLTDYDHLEVPRSLARVSRSPEYAINLLTANINEFHEISRSILGNDRDPRWNIGLWIYEFPEIPAVLASRVKLVDEIWTGSTFAAATFQKYFDGPVVRLHNIVRPRPHVTPTSDVRARWGLRDTATVVLFSFDFGSGWARKNPLAVVRAFREARIAAAADAQLVIKASGLTAPYRAMLRNEIATTDGVLIDAHLSDADLGDLFHAADVYCSLHRAEGFGLGMAEAMAIGKTVIGTRYSGNLDFMHEDNSLLVDCTMSEIRPSDAAANPGLERIVTMGSAWAEPVHQSAVAALTRSFDPAVRAEIGPRAQSEIATNFGSGGAPDHRGKAERSPTRARALPDGLVSALLVHSPAWITVYWWPSMSSRAASRCPQCTAVSVMALCITSRTLNIHCSGQTSRGQCTSGDSSSYDSMISVARVHALA
jgi:glycosyltransferase involved in cell wall biosynthesis